MTFKFSEIKKLPRESYIYCIINNINGKIYIGSAINVYNRLREHRAKLRHIYHPNTYLQRAFTKHKENNFEIDLLQKVEAQDLIFYEQKWLDLTQCWNKRFGYNIEQVAGSRLGSKASKKTRLLMSKSRSKKILQYSLQGKFIKEFKSFRTASKKLNLNAGDLSKVIHKKNKSAGGFMWRLKKSSRFPKEIKCYKGKSIKIQVTDNYTKERLLFNSIAKVKLYFNLGGGALTTAFKGTSRKMKNYSFKRL